MMIYYCQGTGGSLSSKYSLQESILLTSNVTKKVDPPQNALLDLKTLQNGTTNEVKNALFCFTL